MAATTLEKLQVIDRLLALTVEKTRTLRELYRSVLAHDLGGAEGCGKVAFDDPTPVIAVMGSTGTVGTSERVSASIAYDLARPRPGRGPMTARGRRDAAEMVAIRRALFRGEEVPLTLGEFMRLHPTLSAQGVGLSIVRVPEQETSAST